MPVSDVHYLTWTPLARFFDGPLDFEDKTGLHRKVYERLRIADRILWWRADEIAIALGTHPELIWGNEWNDQLVRLTAHEDERKEHHRISAREYEQKRRGRSRAKSVRTAAPSDE